MMRSRGAQFRTDARPGRPRGLSSSRPALRAFVMQSPAGGQPFPADALSSRTLSTPPSSVFINTIPRWTTTPHQEGIPFPHSTPLRQPRRPAVGARRVTLAIAAISVALLLAGCAMAERNLDQRRGDQGRWRLRHAEAN
jgi:hypothetical protein